MARFCVKSQATMNCKAMRDLLTFEESRSPGYPEG